MELDNNIMKLSSALMSLGKRGLLSLSGLTEAVNTLKPLFEDVSEEDKSKMTFFMVLNTEISVINDLKLDEFVGLLTGITSPLIEKMCLILYIYELNLQWYFGEILEQCPSAMTLELLDVLLLKLKEPDFHKDKYGFEHLFILLQGLFGRLIKIDKEIVEDNGSGMLFFYFKQVYELIQSVIVTAMSIKVLNFEMFLGTHFYYLFESILFFMDLLTDNNIDYNNDIFNLSVNLQNNFTNVLRNSAEMCLKEIFNGLPMILENLTVDIWMSWSDIFLQSDDSKPLQRKIGETVYGICEKINEINIKCDVLERLSCIKLKPKNEEDEMAEADIDEVIEKVYSGKKNWLRALVQRDFFHEKALSCLMSNLEALELDDLNTILGKSLEYLSENDGDVSQVRKLFLSCVRYLPKDEHSIWLEKVLGCECNPLGGCDCGEELTKVFNKLSSEDGDYPDVLCLCMQSPEETIFKLCKFGISGSNQTKICVSLLKKLRKACWKTLSSPAGHNLDLLGSVLLSLAGLNDLGEMEKKLYISLIIKLEGEQLIGWNFLKMFLNLLKQSLEGNDMEQAIFNLEGLKVFVGLESFKANKSAILVFMSQVLGHLSWDLYTYENSKARGRELAASIIAKIIRSMSGLKEDDLGWVREEVSKCSEVNQAYFCDLWFQYGHSWVGSQKLYTCLLTLVHSQSDTIFLHDFLIETYSSMEVPLEFEINVILCLNTLLPLFTRSEWLSVFRHLKDIFAKIHPQKTVISICQDVLDIFSSSLYLLTWSLNGKPESYPCHAHCVRNFGYLIKDSILKFKSRILIQTFERIVFWLQAIDDEEHRECCSLTLSPIFLEWLDVVEKDESVYFDRNNFRGLVDVLNVKEVTDAVSRKISSNMY